jgi:hypothetical protein
MRARATIAVEAAIAAALTLAAGACASSRRSDLDFDEARAVKIEVRDDVLLVDGTPSPLDRLPAVLDEAYKALGVTGRRNALVLISYTAKPNENLIEFERRKQSRTQEVLDALSDAGVRNIHLGPVQPEGGRPQTRP